MAWRRPGDKLLSGPMMVRLPTHICVTRPQWLKHNIMIRTNRAVQSRKCVAERIYARICHHSIQRILGPGQNSRQSRAQDSVGTYYAVWLKHITPKLLLQSTNLAGIWSFTNDSQLTFSRILWNRVEELQTKKVSIHTGCINWFDSWEYVLIFFHKRRSAYSFDFMEGAINGFGFHLHP